MFFIVFRHNINFDVWINNARPKIRNVALQQLADHLLLQRPEQFIHKPADLIKGNGHDNEAQNVEENEQQNEEIEAESPVENGNDKKDAVSVNDHSKLDVEPAENDINDAELNSAGHREDYEEEEKEEYSSEDDDEDNEAKSDKEINQ